MARLSSSKQNEDREEDGWNKGEVGVEEILCFTTNTAATLKLNIQRLLRCSKAFALGNRFFLHLSELVTTLFVFLEITNIFYVDADDDDEDGEKCQQTQGTPLVEQALATPLDI